MFIVTSLVHINVPPRGLLAAKIKSSFVLMVGTLIKNKMFVNSERYYS